MQIFLNIRSKSNYKSHSRKSKQFPAQNTNTHIPGIRKMTKIKSPNASVFEKKNSKFEKTDLSVRLKQTLMPSSSTLSFRKCMLLFTCFFSIYEFIASSVFTDLQGTPSNIKIPIPYRGEGRSCLCFQVLALGKACLFSVFIIFFMLSLGYFYIVSYFIFRLILFEMLRLWISSQIVDLF